MEVLGKKGMGSVLKILLQIAFIFGVIILVAFPIIIYNENPSINPNIVIFYPNAICLLIIMYQFVGLFDSLKTSNPFCENTVNRLLFSSKVCGIASIFWFIDFLYEAVLVKNKVSILLVLLFLFILFIGVTIALYILAELFKQALKFKNENELTI